MASGASDAGEGMEQRLAAQASAAGPGAKAACAEAEASQSFSTRQHELAQQAWEQNNIPRMRQLLEDTKDSPYRGFEWYYWQLQTHRAS
jgi:hypothetical protein